MAGGFFDTKIAAVLSKGIKFDDMTSALAACGGVASGIADERTLWQQTGSCSDDALLNLLHKSRGGTTSSPSALVHKVQTASVHVRFILSQFMAFQIYCQVQLLSISFYSAQCRPSYNLRSGQNRG